MGSQSGQKIDMSKFEEGESSARTVGICIRTMDSRTYSLRVDKRLPVLALKERIAAVTDVQPERQCLICRGRVLRDDQLLSDYHVEDEETLHLMVQDPIPPSQTTNYQSGPGYPPRAAAAQGARGDPRLLFGNRPTPNLADPRITSGFFRPSSPRGAPVHISGSSQHNDPRSSHQFSPSAASLRHQQQQVIPNSLTTIAQYLNHMANEFAHIIALERNSTFQPVFYINIPAFRHGLPTAESLAEVLRSMRQLLTNQAFESLTILENQLWEQTNVTDESARQRIQSNAIVSGLSFQNLGALLLELGRTTMMLRMGEYPASAVVNSGSALYITETAPNPLMVLPSDSTPAGVRSDARMGLGEPQYPVPLEEFMTPMSPPSVGFAQFLRTMNVSSGQVGVWSGPGNVRAAAQAAQHLHFAAEGDFRSPLNLAGLATQPPIASTDGNDVHPVPAAGASSRAPQTVTAPSDDGMFLSNLLRQIMPQMSQNMASSSAGPRGAEGEDGQGSSAHRASSGSTSSRRQGDRPPSPNSKRQRQE